MSELDTYLAHRSDRFACCGAHAIQGHTPRCVAEQKGAVLTAVGAATSDDEKARIDAAILAVARRGGEFSANDVRPHLAGIDGQKIGPRFGALRRRGLIEHVGYVPSTKGNTHAHPIALWRAAR